MNTINPTCKFVGILIPTVLLLFVYSPILNVLIFAISFCVTCFCTRSKKTLFASLIPIMLSALALYFSGLHFPAESHLALNYKLFASSAVWNGLQLASRVMAFSGLGLLFALTTDRMDLIHSANQQLKLPAKFSYGLLAAFGMMPNMMQQYRKTRAAFRARGLSPAPWSAALLRPLLVKTVRWSEALAAAMESKGFGTGPRSRYYIVSVTGRDIAFPILTTACFFLVVLLDKAIAAML